MHNIINIFDFASRFFLSLSLPVVQDPRPQQFENNFSNSCFALYGVKGVTLKTVVFLPSPIPNVCIMTSFLSKAFCWLISRRISSLLSSVVSLSVGLPSLTNKITLSEKTSLCVIIHIITQ